MSSINTAAIAHFAKDAPDWWNEDGKFKPLHAINPVRLDYILSVARSHFGPTAPKNLRVLDVGCGGGLMCEPMARLGAKVTGIDADAVAIEVAKNHAAGMGLVIDYQNTAAEKLADNKTRFDIILALEIIEHVDNPPAFVQSLRQLLAPGGLLILSTLNRTPASFAGGIILAERVLGWVAPGTHDWQKFITPAELTAMLADAGMAAQNPRGIMFNPLTRRWFLGESLAINYILCAKAK